MLWPPPAAGEDRAVLIQDSLNAERTESTDSEPTGRFLLHFCLHQHLKCKATFLGPVRVKAISTSEHFSNVYTEIKQKPEYGRNGTGEQSQMLRGQDLLPLDPGVLHQQRLIRVRLMLGNVHGRERVEPGARAEHLPLPRPCIIVCRHGDTSSIPYEPSLQRNERRRLRGRRRRTIEDVTPG